MDRQVEEVKESEKESEKDKTERVSQSGHPLILPDAWKHAKHFRASTDVCRVNCAHKRDARVRTAIHIHILFDAHTHTHFYTNTNTKALLTFWSSAS